MPDLRVLFSKDDILIYISHLDLDHAFIRALNRADVELKYSSGFNPHPKLVFALPLSVGMAGENELLDIGIADEDMTEEKLLGILREQMPPHVNIKKVFRDDRKFNEICAATYTITVDASGLSESLSEFLAGDIVVRKKTKGGEKDINISANIQKISCTEEDGRTVIRAKLDAGESYLNPELILRGAREAGLLGDEPYTIVREQILFGKKKKKHRPAPAKNAAQPGSAETEKPKETE